MPIYTKGGDRGETGLFGNQRVTKTHARVEAYGTVDELNALLGLLRCEDLPATRDQELKEIQETLFEIGADLATPSGNSSVARAEQGVAEMEAWIDRDDRDLPELRTFILPGGHRSAALLHVLRTVCRRAERRVWEVMHQEEVPVEIGTYLNRLSDLFFVWARHANHQHGVADVPWNGRADQRG
ncbi:MAG: cob(I)yrinic acid a,c-diamide adenosyltransferase [Planctomycetota bacterium]